MIRRALYRWIHALPADEETYLSLIVTEDGGQTSSIVLGWTKVTTENRDGLVGRIPRRPILSAGDSLTSAIQLAHQVRLLYFLCFTIFFKTRLRIIIIIIFQLLFLSSLFDGSTSTMEFSYLAFMNKSMSLKGCCVE